MSSYSPLPSKFFRENCQPDLDTNPIYGITHRPISQETRLAMINEIHEKKKPVEAKVNSGKSGIRQVKAWRIPLNTDIAETLNYIILDLN